MLENLREGIRLWIMASGFRTQLGEVEWTRRV
jgi:hypothetical protein